MDLKEFRITHSTLIEHYQFIEAHLEGIYAAVSDKNFADGIKDVEKDSLSGIIREIREIEQEKNINIFTEEECQQLREIINRRNFWCHSCYFELSFDRKTGGLAKVRDVKKLIEDIRDAEYWREALFEKKIEMLKKRNKI